MCSLITTRTEARLCQIATYYHAPTSPGARPSLIGRCARSQGHTCPHACFRAHLCYITQHAVEKRQETCSMRMLTSLAHFATSCAMFSRQALSRSDPGRAVSWTLFSSMQREAKRSGWVTWRSLAACGSPVSTTFKGARCLTW
jgi:hypothetical protein